MKARNLFYLILSAIVISVTIFGCAATSLVSAAVDFGVPPEGGGACKGKGLCTVKPMDNPNTTTSAINVTFTLSPDKNTFIMKFKLPELIAKQPQEAQFFTVNANSYNFDKAFDLTIPIFAPLGLKPGAKILPDTQNTMTIDGDLVTISYQYQHN